eukprot:6750864-Lingulodinium_polyedra.AAC.1
MVVQLSNGRIFLGTERLKGPSAFHSGVLGSLPSGCQVFVANRQLVLQLSDPLNDAGVLVRHTLKVVLFGTDQLTKLRCLPSQA